MNTNLTQVDSHRPSAASLRHLAFRRRRARDRVRAAWPLAFGLIASLSASAPATARAGAPPGESVDRVDPLDLFLDRARGEPAHDEPRGGSFTVGVTTSLGLSSWASPSFGALGFVVVPFDRIREGRRPDLTSGAITRGAAKLPPLDASAPRSADRDASRASVIVAAPSSKSAASAAPSSKSVAPAPASGASSSKSNAAGTAPSTTAPANRSTTASPIRSAAGSTEIDPALEDDDDVEAAPAVEAAIDPAPAPKPLLTPELARGAVRAACKAARLDEADARLDALASRAKTSALLPELRLRATRSIDESESITPTEYDPTRRTASGSTTTWLEARATFRLDRLVFADDEITIERQRMARAAERNRIVERVLDLLDAWQRAHATVTDPLSEPDAQARASLTIATSVASLDVLTEGWFTKAIAAPIAEDRDADVAPVATTSSTPRPADRGGASTSHPADLAPPPSAIEPARAPSASSTAVPAPSAPFAPARVMSSAAPRDAAHPSVTRAKDPVVRSAKALK